MNCTMHSLTHGCNSWAITVIFVVNVISTVGILNHLSTFLHRIKYDTDARGLSHGLTKTVTTILIHASSACESDIWPLTSWIEYQWSLEVYKSCRLCKMDLTAALRLMKLQCNQAAVWRWACGTYCVLEQPWPLTFCLLIATVTVCLIVCYF